MRKFKTIIEGEIRHYESVNDVIDNVKDTVYFEIDVEGLNIDLNLIDIGETIELRDDCIIERIY